MYFYTPNLPVGNAVWYLLINLWNSRFPSSQFRSLAKETALSVQSGWAKVLFGACKGK